MNAVKWQYVTVVLTNTGPDASDKELNRYGAEGFELVSVAEHKLPIGITYRYVFKRPYTDQPAPRPASTTESWGDPW